jgi:NAD(P)-dependent dehydrogenase (short-subunit alcohol dehydrogenase family)
MTVEGKVVLVTGAAGGLGVALCRAFADGGAHVVATDLSRDAVAAATGAGAAPAGTASRVVARSLDVRREPQWSALVQEVLQRYGRLDVLVNNAGVLSPSGCAPLAHEPWDEVFDVNARGVFLGMRHAIPAMTAGPPGSAGGAVVNVSSIAALAGIDFVHMSYGAAKSAVISMTRTAAVQFAAQGVRVNAVVPGVMQRMASARSSSGAPAPSHRDEFLPRVPMGRAATHREVAAAVRFLASDEASYVTGIAMAVDGGYLAQ